MENFYEKVIGIDFSEQKSNKGTQITLEKSASLVLSAETDFHDFGKFSVDVRKIQTAIKKAVKNGSFVKMYIHVAVYEKVDSYIDENGCECTLKGKYFDAWKYCGYPSEEYDEEYPYIHLDSDTRYTPMERDMIFPLSGNIFECEDIAFLGTIFNKN